MAKALPNSVPALQKTVSSQNATIIELRADKREADKRTKEAVASANKKNSAFRRALASGSTYSVLGAVGGGLIAYYLIWDYLASYFEEGSYVPGLILAVAGGAFAFFAPRQVKGGEDKEAAAALMKSGLRGFGLGVAGFGAWQFYTAWTATSEQG